MILTSRISIVIRSVQSVLVLLVSVYYTFGRD